MKNKIDELIKSGNLAEIYFYSGNEGSFCCGRIMAVDDRFFAFQSFDPYGRYDGYDVREISDIYEIAVDTKYLKALDIFIGESKPEPLCIQSDCIVKEILALSYKNKEAVTLDVDNTEELQIGIVTDIYETRIEINLFNEYGEPDGVASINMDDILSVRYNSLDERKIEKLVLAKQ